MHTDINVISYFPKLPSLRKQKIYKADSSKSSVCTKKKLKTSITATGDIYSVYCQHGNAACMIIIIITPHTVLLEYFAGEKPLRMSQISRKFDPLLSNYCVLASIY